MRCKNCGWLNEPNASRCVKCNAPLQGSMIEQTPSQPSSESTPLKSTLREAPSQADWLDPEAAPVNNNRKCRQCGYPLGTMMKECPVCHTPIDGAPYTPQGGQGMGYSASRGGTVNPWMRPTQDTFCTLRRIAWDNEQVTYEPVSYSGESILLNRANTDANNHSITSKVQAVLTHENGEWFIQNQSEQKTTLIRVDKKTKLEDGDVIILGNRLFEFKKG